MNSQILTLLIFLLFCCFEISVAAPSELSVEVESHLLKILDVDKDIKDISDPANFYPGAETFEEVFEKTLNIEEKIDNEGPSFLNNFLHTINGYKEMLSSELYFNSPIIKNVNEKTIQHLETYFKKACDIMDKNNDNKYKNKYYNKLIDYHPEPGSKYFSMKILEVLDNIIYDINAKEGLLNRGLGVKINGRKFTMEIDYKTIDKDAVNLDDAINKLCSRIKTLNDTTLMDKYFSTLIGLFKSQSNKNIWNIVSRKLIFCTDPELDNTGYLKNTKVPSDNSLSLEGLFDVESFDLINDITDPEKVPTEMIPYIINGLKYQLSKKRNSNDESTIFTITIANGIKIKLLSLGKELYQFKINSRKFIDHYLTLFSEYNDLAAIAITFGNYSSSNDQLSVIELNNTLVSAIKYVYTVEFNKVIQNIIDANHDKFYEINFDHSTIHYDSLFNDLGRVMEYSAEDLKRAILNTQKNRRDQLIKIFIDAADDETKITLNKVYNTKYLLVRCSAPLENNDDYLDVTTNSEMITLPQKDFTIYYDYIVNNLIKFLEKMKKYDENITLNNPSYVINRDNLIINNAYHNGSSISEILNSINNTIDGLNQKGTLSDGDKSNIKEAAKILYGCIRGSQHKMTLISGRCDKNTLSYIKRNYEIISYYDQLFSDL